MDDEVKGRISPGMTMPPVCGAWKGTGKNERRLVQEWQGETPSWLAPQAAQKGEGFSGMLQ